MIAFFQLTLLPLLQLFSSAAAASAFAMRPFFSVLRRFFLLQLSSCVFCCSAASLPSIVATISLSSLLSCFRFSASASVSAAPSSCFSNFSPLTLRLLLLLLKLLLFFINFFFLFRLQLLLSWAEFLFFFFFFSSCRSPACDGLLLLFINFCGPRSSSSLFVDCLLFF